MSADVVILTSRLSRSYLLKIISQPKCISITKITQATLCAQRTATALSLACNGIERHPSTASGFENPRFYLREFAVQHLEFRQFPLDAPATVGRLLSLGERDAHAVTGRRISAFFRSLQRRTDFFGSIRQTHRAIKRKTAGGGGEVVTSAAVMVALQWPRFSHHQSVLVMCCWSSLCSFSMALISSFSLLTICNQSSRRAQFFEQCLFHRRFCVKLR